MADWLRPSLKVTLLSQDPGLNIAQACFIQQSGNNPPASKASTEVANLTERKNLHTPRIWCQRICLSVCDKL